MIEQTLDYRSHSVRKPPEALDRRENALIRLKDRVGQARDLSPSLHQNLQ